MTVKEDLKKSTYAFYRYVEPFLKKELGWRILPCEMVDNEAMRVLDRQAGIDFWAVDDDGVRGVASRIQYGRMYPTFTVRYRRRNGATTEFAKRVKAIEEGYLYPYYTMQAYIIQNELVGIGVVKTESLYQYILNGRSNKDYMHFVGHDGNEFLIVHWSDLPKNDIWLWIKG